MTLTDLGNFIRSNPCAWQDLTADQQALARAGLLPQDGFAPDQRYLLHRWWLACTAQDVEAVNALLPQGTQVSAIEHEGGLYLGGDLLTDALTQGHTYHPALSVLQTLTCTFIDPPPKPAEGQV